MPNWCWAEWGFKFSLLKDRLKELDFFDSEKLDSLYNNIETNLCNPHDNDFANWWWILDFIRANLNFSIWLLRILHWTSVKSKIIIFLISFIGLNIFWIKYFKWTKVI